MVCSPISSGKGEGGISGQHWLRWYRSGESRFSSVPSSLPVMSVPPRKGIGPLDVRSVCACIRSESRWRGWSLPSPIHQQLAATAFKNDSSHLALHAAAGRVVLWPCRSVSVRDDACRRLEAQRASSCGFSPLTQPCCPISGTNRQPPRCSIWGPL